MLVRVYINSLKFKNYETKKTQDTLHVIVDLNIHFVPQSDSSQPTSDPKDYPSRSQTVDINPDSILDIPQEGKYSQVRRYIQERCRFDPEFKRFIDNSSRVEICRRLTRLFGWYVDDKSLGKNLNRHR